MDGWSQGRRREGGKGPSRETSALDEQDWKQNQSVVK